MSAPDGIDWGENYSRVPYALYHDAALHEREQERIFRGRTWSYLCLAAEIPAPGDFRVVSVGDTPVVVSRREDGTPCAFVNRCAHRGATVRREIRGNAKEHVCVYHRWCYALDGTLIGVPFKRGVGGLGGMPKSFENAEHGLRRLRVDSIGGALFGSFREDTESLPDFLGETLASHLRRLMHKPLRLLGYQRQAIGGNWKLYMENVRDTYHGSLLHEFQNTFSISRATHAGGASMDRQRRHHISYNTGDDAADGAKLYAEAGVEQDRMRLRDPRLLQYIPEFADGLQFTMCSVFPNAVFQQIRNCLATRQVRTRGCDAFDLVVTLYGFEDDTESMTAHRLRQANMVGPAGYISMEDGEAIEIAHRASRSAAGDRSIIAMGGTGEIPEKVQFRASEVPIRGFWSHYAKIMESRA